MRTAIDIVYIYLFYSFHLTHTMIDFITLHLAELVIGLLAFIKVIVNLTPTEEDNAVFGKLDTIINFFIKDKLK